MAQTAKKATTKRTTAATKTAGVHAEEREAMKNAPRRSRRPGAAWWRQRRRAGDDGQDRRAVGVGPRHGRAPPRAITASAGLSPKLWYGMPGYAKDGKVLASSSHAQFKSRYAFEFNDGANLDDGNVWPVAFALTKLTAADVKTIAGGEAGRELTAARYYGSEVASATPCPPVRGVLGRPPGRRWPRLTCSGTTRRPGASRTPRAQPGRRDRAPAGRGHPGRAIDSADLDDQERITRARWPVATRTVPPTASRNPARRGVGGPIFGLAGLAPADPRHAHAAERGGRRRHARRPDRRRSVVRRHGRATPSGTRPRLGTGRLAVSGTVAQIDAALAAPSTRTRS